MIPLRPMASRRLPALLILGGLAIAAALSFLGLPRLLFDHDTRSLLRGDAESDRLERELIGTFGSEDILLLAWPLPRGLDAEEFRRIEKATGALSAVEGLEETYSLASTRVPLPLETLRPLRAEDLATEEGRARTRAAMLDSPVYLGTIYNRSLDVVAIAATVKPGPRAFRERAVRDARAVAALFSVPGSEIRVAGVTALAMDANAYAMEDLRRIGALALAASVLVLLLLCGSLADTLAAVIATGLPPLFALGIAQWLGVPLSALGAALFPVLAVVGITTSLHLLHSYAEQRRGLPPERAASAAARRMLAPVSLSLLTTAAGFFSLGTTGVPAFAAGGRVVGAGVLMALPVVLLGLPAALALFRLPAGRSGRRRSHRLLLRLAFFVRRRSVAIVAGSLLLSVGGGAAALSARVRVDVLQAFQPASAVARTYRFLDEQLTATLPVDLVLRARPSTPPQEILEDLRAFTEKALSEKGVESALSFATLVDQGNRFVQGRLPLPGVLALLRGPFAGQTRRFEEAVERPEGRRYRVKMRVREGTDPAVLERLARAAAGMRTGSASLTGLYVRAVGTARGLLRNVAQGVGAMTLLVVITVMLAARSWKLGLAALLPNVLPPAIVFGGAHLLGVRLDVAAVAVGAVSIGLTVDHTLYVVFRLAEERRRGHPIDRAILRTQRAVGRPMLLSTLALVCGLGCLALSNFLPTAHFGLFTAAACAVGVFGALIVLPAVVHTWRAL